MKTKSSAILIAVAFGLLAFLQKTHAVVPTPDGCYPNFTTAEGCDALNLLTTGAANTGLGWRSLFSDSTGSFNTGVGAGALVLNNADANTAVGAAALLLNTAGTKNTAVGTDALVHNEIGEQNTATGFSALFSNTIGELNTAIGSQALFSTTNATGNTAVGLNALFNNTEGGNNTAIGRDAIHNNETGELNTAIGYAAGANLTGDGNVCIGGATGDAGVDNTTWVSNVNTLTQNFSAGVNDYVTVRLSDGRLGHTAVVSSRRYKENIKPLAASSEALYALKPVSFRLKKEYDETQALGFGLIAEEVEQVHSDLVYRNAKGEVESVRYEMVNAMLLNEFLKEHCKVEEQQAAIVELKSVVAQQQKEFRAAMAEQQKEMENVIARLKQQEAKIQKVNDRIELTEPASQVVANNE